MAYLIDSLKLHAARLYRSIKIIKVLKIDRIIALILCTVDVCVCVCVCVCVRACVCVSVSVFVDSFGFRTGWLGNQNFAGQNVTCRNILRQVTFARQNRFFGSTTLQT